MSIEAGSAPIIQHTIRVLIADDDSRVRHAIRAFVEADPSMVVAGEAGSAEEVLKCERALHPSVILLDLILPQAEDGLRLLKFLAQTEHRPVIALSLRGSLRAQALEAGACAFVEKGAPPEVLLAALRAASSERKAIDTGR